MAWRIFFSADAGLLAASSAASSVSFAAREQSVAWAMTGEASRMTRGNTIRKDLFIALSVVVKNAV
jgi:hypothetical protein